MHTELIVSESVDCIPFGPHNGKTAPTGGLDHFDSFLSEEVHALNFEGVAARAFEKRTVRMRRASFGFAVVHLARLVHKALARLATD